MQIWSCIKSVCDGELLLTIMSSLSQEESRSISENVRWGQRKRAADGKYSLGYAHFLGYDKGPDGTPVINKEQAIVVRKIYGLFLEGYSYNKIAKILTEEGIPTRAGKKNWRDVTIAGILTNETYMGDKILQKTYTLDFLHKTPIKNQGQVPMYHIEQDHEAIIPPETFKRVQDEILRRKNRPLQGQTIFSGKIFCGCCGATFGPKVWHSNDKYRRVIWQCNNKYKGTKICRMPHLYEDRIEADFLKVCRKLSIDRDEIISNLRELQTLVGGTEELEKERADLEIERNFLADRLQALIDRNAKEAQDQVKYIKQYDELSGKYKKAEEKLTRLDTRIRDKEMRNRRIAAFIDAVEQMPDTVSEFSIELWATLIDQVTVYGKKDVRFTLSTGEEIQVD